MADFNSGYWHALDKERPVVKTSNIGYTTSGVKDQLEELKAKIFTGASHIELGFSGVGKGSIAGGKVTPGLFGKDQREEMRQLSKINEVTLSTHATTGVMGLAGMTERGGFSENMRRNALDEIKQAIEFNADVGGRAVVLHVGEFNRPTGEREAEGKIERKGFIDYGEGIPQTLVDLRNGETVFSFNLKSHFELPKVVQDEKTGRWKVSHDTLKPGIDDATGKIKSLEQSKEDVKRFLESQVTMNRGRAEHYMSDYKRLKNNIAKFDKMSDAEKIAFVNHSRLDLEEVWKQGDIHEVFKKAKELLVEEEKIIEAEAIGYAHQFVQYDELKKNIRTAKEYALGKSTDSIAEAGILAMNQTKEKELKDPIFVAPESIFPEQYGGHPEELKELVIKSRKVMEERLVKEKHLSREEAKKKAETHIKATFDIGHAYLWKKYFKGTDEEFNKWMLNQADDLIKNKIVGHVHVTDNMGYADDHLPMGEGKVPLAKFTEILSKREFKGNIIAEAGDRDYGTEPAAALRGAWKTMGSPIYRVDIESEIPIPRPGMGMRRSMGWVDIEQSYFGRTTGPTYLVGEKIVPSKDWIFWSEVPLE